MKLHRRTDFLSSVLTSLASSTAWTLESLNTSYRLRQKSWHTSAQPVTEGCEGRQTGNPTDSEWTERQTARSSSGGIENVFCISPTNTPVQNVLGRLPAGEWRDHLSLALSRFPSLILCRPLSSLTPLLPPSERWMVDRGMEEISSSQIPQLL